MQLREEYEWSKIMFNIDTYNLRRKIQANLLQLTSYEFMTKLYYFIRFKRIINLKKPYYFNEKINWLKLNNYSQNELVIKGADKYEVREYIIEKGLGNTLNDLLGVWDEWDDSIWESLPNKFALKCTHGAQYNVISKDKTNESKDDIERKMKRWLSEDFGKFNAEPQYSKVKRRIICEKYLEEDMIDYKFFCFNGEPKFFYIAKGFGQLKNERMDYYNLDGTKAKFRNPSYESLDRELVFSKEIEEMIKISEILSEDFPFVRVDLFLSNNKVYFSELTFTPTAGLMELEPVEAYEVLGNYLDLSTYLS